MGFEYPLKMRYVCVHLPLKPLFSKSGWSPGGVKIKKMYITIRIIEESFILVRQKQGWRILGS